MAAGRKGLRSSGRRKNATSRQVLGHLRAGLGSNLHSLCLLPAWHQHPVPLPPHVRSLPRELSAASSSTLAPQPHHLEVKLLAALGGQRPCDMRSQEHWGGPEEHLLGVPGKS